MLIDTHAHLADNSLYADLHNVIAKASKNDVKKIITIGCSFMEISTSRTISKKYQNIYYSGGLYPLPDINEYKESDNNLTKHIKRYEKLLESINDEIIGIGECGLDFNTHSSFQYNLDRNSQIKLFSHQIELALHYKKPLIIHSRNSTMDTIRILNNYKSKFKNEVVWHCFTDNNEIAIILADLGITISVNGIITYKNADDLRNSLIKYPLDKIILETDSPFLVPHTPRSMGIKINSPEYVKITAEKLAEIRNVPYEIIENATTRNAERIFNI